MKKLSSLIKVAFVLAALLVFNLSAQKVTIKTGLQVLIESDFAALKGKKVGLITNPTGVDEHLKSTIDILAERTDFSLVALYGPEHGVRGDYSAGDEVGTTIDAKTGIKAFSLYGKTRKPTPDMLKDIDVLVYDIQDIGCRSYTYISTMGLAIEAAAENKKEFIVLDRPNPLGGNRIEGNIVEPENISFVSNFKIPYVYGLTPGELANLLNEEKMLKNGVHCNLTVIGMHNWHRDMNYGSTGLPWVPSSPHVPDWETAFYYVCTGIMGELSYFTEGVGYPLPFKVMGAEWINGYKMATELNKLNLPGVDFRPITYKPYYGGKKDKIISGVQIHIYDYATVDLMQMQFLFMELNYKLYPNKNPFLSDSLNRFSMFDKVCGSNKVRAYFSKNLKFSDIKPVLDKDKESFKKLSSKYYLYN